MRVSVFAGPTIAARKIKGVEWHGPAAAGDLLALAEGEPHRVLLIDGVFDGHRSPWHKEILVLLSLGFDVSGAASLGALRAVELEAFGMRALGAVAGAYRDGRITGDDEVAVAHAPAELGYRPLSIAQVDVRATLLAAVRQRVFNVAEARRLLEASRAIHFKRRSWEAIAKVADALFGDVPRFSDWLEGNRVPRKAIDASLALKAAIREPFLALRRDAPPETVFLRRLRDQVSHRRFQPPLT